MPVHEAAHVQIINRHDDDCPTCSSRLGHFEIWVGTTWGQHASPAIRCAEVTADSSAATLLVPCEALGVAGRFVTVLLTGDSRIINLMEVRAYIIPTPPAPPSSPRSPEPPPRPPLDPPPPRPPLPAGYAGCDCPCGRWTACNYALYPGDGGPEPYRLGDMFLGPIVDGNSVRDGWGGRDAHFANYPQSIASEYLHETDAQADYNVLARIVQRRATQGGSIPPPSTAVFHIRAGDVLELDMGGFGFHGDMERVYRDGLLPYVQPLSYFDTYLQQLPTLVTHVILVCGSHYDHDNNDWPYSTAYLNAVRDRIRTHNYVVEIITGRTADEDLIYMGHADYFLSSGGGFSQTIQGLVLVMGGVALGEGHTRDG